ncbi:hypothetical protein [Streptomyces sp. NRRL WC-3742]|uniref:hypothetical protein n=1 Tax=Streptomyces sp. NRRL WC-3742 TaxID=1463934 RepID=UPI000B1686FD|nr:hypothetical protein [Streptomyces sp. NRRL WC-3742]
MSAPDHESATTGPAAPPQPAPAPAAPAPAPALAVPEQAPAPAAPAVPAPAAPEQAPAPEPEPEPAPEPYGPGDPSGPAPARRMPRAARIALATAGLLAVTAACATATVALGRPDARPVAAAPARPAAGAGAPASASPAPTAVPVPVPTPAAPAPEPKPASTVKGTVSGGRHEGDLRFFLLPIPDGGESYGSADGTSLSDDQVAGIFGKQDGIKDLLHSFGYQDAATRIYRTADGRAEVTVTLIHLGSTAQATQFAKGYSVKSQESIDIDGDPDAHGFVHKPKQQAYTGSMTGISSQGDVQYTIDVDVKGTPDKALLSDLMKRQRERLASGG